MSFLQLQRPVAHSDEGGGVAERTIQGTIEYNWYPKLSDEISNSSNLTGETKAQRPRHASSRNITRVPLRTLPIPCGTKADKIESRQKSVPYHASRRILLKVRAGAE